MTVIVLDVETTGLEVTEGDRIVEIGMVEVEGDPPVPTGRKFQKYINPQREVSSAAYEVHGLSDEFLRSKPTFADIVDELLEFIADSPIVAHNAGFDIAFVNTELRFLGREQIAGDRVTDTLTMARADSDLAGLQRFSLDALCRHFDIDSSERQQIAHGALRDAELLAKVYFNLLGGGRDMFASLDSGREESPAGQVRCSQPVMRRPMPLVSLLTEEEAKAHAQMVDSLGENALWKRFK